MEVETVRGWSWVSVCMVVLFRVDVVGVIEGSYDGRKNEDNDVLLHHRVEQGESVADDVCDKKEGDRYDRHGNMWMRLAARSSHHCTTISPARRLMVDAL